MVGRRGRRHERRPAPAGLDHPGHVDRRVCPGDPAPTLDQFQTDVAAGQIRYFVTGGDGGGQAHGGGAGTSAAITAWVTSHFTHSTVGGRTVYDLTRPTS